MRVHDQIREALAHGLDEEVLLDLTARLARIHGNGETVRPIVAYTILTVLDGTRRRWFEGHPTTVELAATLTARLVPAVTALLQADERGQPAELLVALDDLASIYRQCAKEFRQE